MLRFKLILILLIISIILCSCKANTEPQTTTADVAVSRTVESVAKTSETTVKATVPTTSDSKKMYREGFFCNALKQSEYETVKALCEGFFNKSNPTDEHSLWNSVDWCVYQLAFLNSDSQSKESQWVEVSSSKKANAFFKYYCEKMRKQGKNGEKLSYKDKGYSIENFSFDVDGAFWLTDNIFYNIYAEGQGNLKELLSDSSEIEDRIKLYSHIYVPMYYEDELCSLIRCGNTMPEDYKTNENNREEPFVDFDGDINSDVFEEIVPLVKSKEAIKKWCNNLGLKDVQDVMFSKALTDYQKIGPGLVAYIITKEGNYVYTNKVVGLSELNRKVTSVESIIKNYSEDYSKAVAQIPTDPLTGDGE